jgi:hypothetical protein
MSDDSVAVSENVSAVLRKAITHWRVYYLDDTVAASEDTTWEDCPHHNVQAVLTMRPSRCGGHVVPELQINQAEYRLECHDLIKYAQEPA